MDPQHRLMIEVAYQSLENAGLSIKDVAGSKTGIFIGHNTSDYRESLFKDPDTAPMYTFSGSTKTSLANRISWLFDLHGPSFSLGTACSSSLVALHLACQSLRTGECYMAIVGGVNLLLNPEMFMFLSNQHFLSPDGKCKSFEESGDGYGRGEGIAAIVLKRADEASTGRDPIRAVIRSTGSNQDGHTKGFTLPSADTQAALIRDTYAAADLDFRSTGYVEAHGKGTQAGDTEETLALSETISKGRSSDDPLYIGSVKSNIGHLEACAGLAGILKSILILERGVIPLTIHYEKGNAKIKFEQWGLKVPTALTSWPASGLRRISVNSFGYGGTNAHAILDDAYHYLQSFVIQGIHRTEMSGRGFEKGEVMSWSSISGFPSSSVKRRFSEHANGVFDGVSNYGAKSTQKAAFHNATSIQIRPPKKDDINRDRKLYRKDLAKEDERPQNNGNDRGAEADSRIFLFSAQDREGLMRTKKALADHLMGRSRDETCNTQAYLADLSFTLSRRATLQWRTSCAATSIEHLLEQLQNEEISLATRASENPRIGFVFTGQGAQWPRMGVEAMVYPAFRESIQAADQHLREACSCAWSVEDELMKGKFSSRPHLAAFSQTICTVLQVAMVDLLRTWSITPVAVAGHSSGEIGAAYCLGALSREDAWRVAYYRGVVSTALKEVAPDISGPMMAVGLSPKQAEMWISQAENEGEVVLACINSPSSVTLSGDKADIDRMTAKFAENGIFARKLKVDTAYHSPHMQLAYRRSLQMLGKKKKLQLPRFFGSHHHTNLLRPCATSTSSQQIANPNHLNRSNLSLYRFPFSVINQSCLFVDKHDPEALVLYHHHQPLVRLPIGSLLVHYRPLLARLPTGSLLAIGARGEGG